MTMHSSQHRTDRPPCRRRHLAQDDHTPRLPLRRAWIDRLHPGERPTASIGRAGEEGDAAGLPAIRRSVLGPGQAKTFVGALF